MQPSFMNTSPVESLRVTSYVEHSSHNLSVKIPAEGVTTCLALKLKLGGNWVQNKDVKSHFTA